MYVVTSKHKKVGNSIFIVDVICSSGRFGVIWAQILTIRSILEKHMTTSRDVLFYLSSLFQEHPSRISILIIFAAATGLSLLGPDIMVLELSSWPVTTLRLVQLFIASAEKALATATYISIAEMQLVNYLCDLRDEFFTPPLHETQMFEINRVTFSLLLLGFFIYSFYLAVPIEHFGGFLKS